MTTTLALVGFVVSLGPLRQASRLRALSPSQATVAAVAAAVLIGLLALGAEPLLDWADVSGPTARIGAGLAVAATALVRLIRPALPFDDPPVEVSDSIVAGLVPAAFPVLMQPVVGLLTVAVAAERGPGMALASAVPALGVWLALMFLADHPTGSSTVLTRVLATVGLPVGVAMIVGGIFAV